MMKQLGCEYANFGENGQFIFSNNVYLKNITNEI